MSIRIKLLLSYTAMLLISLLMFVIASGLYTVASTGELHSLKDFYKGHYRLNPLTASQESIYFELKYIAKSEPDTLLNDKLLMDYEYKLRTEKAGLLVRRESNTVFESYTFDQPQLKDALPPYELNNNQIRNTFNIGERFYGYAKFDFKYTDGARGSIFVIRERSPFAELTRRLLPILSVLLLGVVIVANVLLYRWITRSVVKPLNRLRGSAERIKEGDLQFRLDLNTKDEIGQLNEAFESMRQRLQESVQLRLQDEENRKALLSNISHDLKTPITNIKGYVEGIRDGVANTPEKLEQYVDIIYSKAVAMDKLVDELFLYAKLDLKQFPFTFEHVDIVRFLDDCVEELRYELEAKGASIAWMQRPEPGIDVIADLSQLKRIVLNIVGNAMKYSDKEAPRIQLALHVQPDAVTVEIRDNGSGIPPEAIPHIFERFYRAEPSRNSATGGSGLGLAIAKQIIEGHGGRIWATSEPGLGTSLYFTLKRAQPRSVTLNEEGGSDTDDTHPHH